MGMGRWSCAQHQRFEPLNPLPPSPNPGPAEVGGNFLVDVQPQHLARGPDFLAERLESLPPLPPASHNAAKRFALDFLGFELGIGSETKKQWKCCSYTINSGTGTTPTAIQVLLPTNSGLFFIQQAHFCACW